MLTQDEEIFEKLSGLLSENKFRSVSLHVDGTKVTLEKEMPLQAVVPMVSSNSIDATAAILDDEEIIDELEIESIEGKPIECPMTGVYYLSSSPGAPPFVSVGSQVSAGQVVALVEAMKVFNEIVAPEDGVVFKLVAEVGKVVNAGDVLMILN